MGRKWEESAACWGRTGACCPGVLCCAVLCLCFVVSRGGEAGHAGAKRAATRRNTGPAGWEAQKHSFWRDSRDSAQRQRCQSASKACEACETCKTGKGACNNCEAWWWRAWPGVESLCRDVWMPSPGRSQLTGSQGAREATRVGDH